MTPRVRLGLWVAIIVLLLAGQVGWFVLLRASRILASDAVLIGGHLAAGGLLLAMLGLLATTPADAIRLSRGLSHRIILLGALALHLAALALLWPGLSDDVVRYRLDGRMWLVGKSPYAITPQAFFDSQPRAADAIDRLVTYPSMHTIYPPIAQVVFAGGRAVDEVVGRVSGHGRESPASPQIALPDATIGSGWRDALIELNWLQRAGVLRVLMAACALLATAVGLRLLQEMGLSPWYATLFAWHPLTIMETAGHAHIDILGVLFLLAMLLDVHRRRFAAAGVLLALAVCVKPHAIVFLPFLWRAAWQAEKCPSDGDTVAEATFADEPRPQPHWIVPVVTLGAIALLVIPVLLYQDGYAGWLRTARTYAQAWEANGSVYELLRAVIGRGDGHRIVFAGALARYLLAGGLVVTAILLWRRRATLAEAGYWLTLIPLLLAPVVYPWYLLWLMAFIPFIPARQALVGMVWAATIVFSYLLWRSATWRLPAWAMGAEYVPVYVSLLIALLPRGRRAASARDHVAAVGVQHLAGDV